MRKLGQVMSGKMGTVTLEAVMRAAKVEHAFRDSQRIVMNLDDVVRRFEAQEKRKQAEAEIEAGISGKPQRKKIIMLGEL